MFLSIIWWLEAVKRIGKFIWKTTFEQKKKKRGFKLNPRLVLIRLAILALDFQLVIKSPIWTQIFLQTTCSSLTWHESWPGWLLFKDNTCEQSVWVAMVSTQPSIVRYNHLSSLIVRIILSVPTTLIIPWSLFCRAQYVRSVFLFPHYGVFWY